MTPYTSIREIYLKASTQPAFRISLKALKIRLAAVSPAQPPYNGGGAIDDVSKFNGKCQFGGIFRHCVKVIEKKFLDFTSHDSFRPTEQFSSLKWANKTVFVLPSKFFLLSGAFFTCKIPRRNAGKNEKTFLPP